ncbi:MAG: NADH-quinone oxidoreductase subunit NuoE [Clostridia bacterium]|jgi:NADH:ubiquinone oxidoreductase subunit E|nr:NADH-quinone oxidoreductase subunit NuoE [Clostridia bacterium]MBR5378936.1 NADH-quinone oxidoreductase subunit NuoE [Clostridia bacterium]
MAISQDKYDKLDEVISANKGQSGAVMRTLQAAQDIFGHVPKDVQIRIAEGLGTTLSDVYGVATFYSQFALEPRGEYIIGVCLGTACYVKGSKNVLERVCKELDTKVGKTSKDGLFTIKDTRCLGACGLAPVMMINDDVYGRLTPDKIPDILAKYRQAQ